MKRAYFMAGTLIAGLVVVACDDTTGTGGAGGAGTSSSSASSSSSSSGSTSTTSSSASSTTTTSATTTSGSSMSSASSSGSGTATSSSSTGGGACVTLDPGMLQQFGMDGEFLTSTPTIADPAKPDEFDILFYGMPYVPAADTYDLASAGVNDNYATCAECVSFVQDVDANNVADKVFFQSEGTLTITATDQNLPNVSEGTLTNVKLIEVTIDPNTYVSTPVPGGDCYLIPSLAWDTKP